MVLRRDVVLISVLYDTGARVQELIDLTVGDVRLITPAQRKQVIVAMAAIIIV